MKESIEQQIIDYAKSTEPHECCGFILRDHMAGERFYYPCQNVATDPLNFFEITPEEQIEAEKLGWIEAVVHYTRTVNLCYRLPTVRCSPTPIAIGC